MRSRVLLGLLGLLTPALAAVPAGPASADVAGGRSTPEAHQALTHAKDLFARPSGFARRTTSGGRIDATGVLRTLALRMDDLSADDRRVARRILARPTDQGTDPLGYGYTTAEQTPYCTTHICVHWVSTTTDAPALTDTDSDTVPDQVELTAQTFEDVWAKEVDGMGYNRPLADGATGGDSDKLDVYLVNSGTRGRGGVYGFCSTDEDVHLGEKVPAYCGVDNDFAEFGSRPALQSLQVTAAHEFFHAVQFGYDASEDLWLAESTAAWMEDQVYDDINDNYQYFKAGPLAHPGIPLDYFEPDASDPRYYYPQYGGWVFWTFLSESLHDPGVVRDVWTRAARSGGYSLSALRGALAARGTTFTDMFARFGAVNRYPGRVYSEGRAYPAAPLAKTWTLSKRHPRQKALKARLSHLTNISVRYRPARTLRTRHLRIALDMPATFRGSAATAVVHFRNGDLSRRRIHLDRSGAGHLRVPFTRRKVAAVDLTLTDASTRYSCWKDASLYFGSCYGIPKDDQLVTVFSAKTVR